MCVCITIHNIKNGYSRLYIGVFIKNQINIVYYISDMSTTLGRRIGASVIQTITIIMFKCINHNI